MIETINKKDLGLELSTSASEKITVKLNEEFSAENNSFYPSDKVKKTVLVDIENKDYSKNAKSVLTNIVREIIATTLENSVNVYIDNELLSLLNNTKEEFKSVDVFSNLKEATKIVLNASVLGKLTLEERAILLGVINQDPEFKVKQLRSLINKDILPKELVDILDIYNEEYKIIYFGYRKQTAQDMKYLESFGVGIDYVFLF